MSERSGGRVNGKTALITGAGTGIGAAIARRFAHEGARVVLTQLDAGPVEEVAAAIVAAGGEALAISGADVSQPDDVARVITAACDRFGPLDILVNNAGIAGGNGDFLDVSLETWQRVLAVNLTGMFLYGQAVARQMVARGVRGRIVNVGSVNAFAAERGAAAYVASKGGVLGLTRAMAVDLAPHGICVTCLAPGPIRVERNATLFDGPLAATLGRGVPLGHPGTADEAAAAALFLASDEASFVTGAALVVDGGTLAALPIV